MLSVLYEVLNFRAMRRRLLQIYEANSLVLLNQPGCARHATQANVNFSLNLLHDFGIYCPWIPTFSRNLSILHRLIPESECEGFFLRKHCLTNSPPTSILASFFWRYRCLYLQDILFAFGISGSYCFFW